ncbi:MAG TPA: dCTP deaminase [Bryobacteraceae bacterium]|jgi:dCTP deaminase|nr:dCTP deaminase [Bryobacteraceae bacterium]
MVLSDIDIKNYIEQAKIKISPALPPEQFGSCSVDFRLGSEFSVFEHSRHAFIDLRDKTAIQDLMRTIKVPAGEPFIMQPGEFALAITEETLELDDDVLGRLEGRSSLGRIGIIVHGTAGLFDPGWAGKATLELSNLGRMPVALYPGMRICSFTFEQLSSRVAVPYRKKVGNKYSGQERPLASKLASETGGE